MRAKNEHVGERHAAPKITFHKYFAFAALAIAIAAPAPGSAAAQDTIKIGLVMPMTGTVGAAGQEVVAAVKLYMAQHGDTVAGKKIELFDQG